jgi:hypothetical protein
MSKKQRAWEEYIHRKQFGIGDPFAPIKSVGDEVPPPKSVGGGSPRRNRYERPPKSAGPAAAGYPLDSLTSSTSSNDQGPRINTCCPCIGCLNACIRETESGGEGNPTTNPVHLGCNAGSTDGGTDCGPYQIDPANYVQDICDIPPVMNPDGTPANTCVPCNHCNGGNGYGGGSDPCCIEPGPCTPGWADLLCTDCPTLEYPDMDACCAEKTARSLRLMDCYRRRWTRNNPCRGTGNEVNPYPDGDLTCYTCQDLARMHQGGFRAPCQKSAVNDTYWNKVKACMARKCRFTVSADGTEVCEYITEL